MVEQDVSSTLVAATVVANNINVAAFAEHLESVVLLAVPKAAHIARAIAISICHLLHSWVTIDQPKMDVLATVADAA